MADKIINLFNANCCGEVGDVIVEGDINLEGKTILEQSNYLFKNKIPFYARYSSFYSYN